MTHTQVLSLTLPSCQQGSSFFIGCSGNSDFSVISNISKNQEFILSQLSVGTTFFCQQEPLIKLVSKISAPNLSDNNHTSLIFHVQAMRNISAGVYPTTFSKLDEYSLACVTLSDKGALGEREDLSGVLLTEKITSLLPISLTQRFMLPDDYHQIKGLVAHLALNQGFDLIVTTGGTGVSSRDVTPEAVKPLLDRELPGFTQAMNIFSLNKTPLAAIGRPFAGVINKSLIICLPGSKKGALENLEAILPALPHALSKINDLSTNCGG